MLERAHRFLTARDRSELEAAAERFFTALGYRRIADVDDQREALIFERGSTLAAFYAPSLRSCFARLEVTLERGDGTGVASVRHSVHTRGRLVLPEDKRLIEGEARAFEMFLERAEVDTLELLENARRSGRASTLATIAAAVGLVAAAVVVLVVLLASRLAGA